MPKVKTDYYQQNIIEKKALSGLCLENDPEKVQSLLNGFNEDYFINRTHQLLYSYINYQSTSHAVWDLDHFFSLINQPFYNEIDNSEYGPLSSYLHNGLHSEIEDYLMEIRKAYHLRFGASKIIEVYEAVSSGSASANPSQLLFDAAEDINSVSPYGEDIKSYGEIIEDEIMEMEKAFQEGIFDESLKSHLPGFDKKFRGFKKGEYIILGGRPSMGKTSMALSILLGMVAETKFPVIFFSGEMDPKIIRKKLISMFSKYIEQEEKNGHIPLSAVLDFIEYDKYRESIKITAKNLAVYLSSKFFILDARGKGLPFIHSEVGKIKQQYGGVGMVCIDYLQLMKMESKRQRNEEVESLSRSFKWMAGIFNIPVMVLSQLNRELEKRDNKRPIASDLRDSGSIEQDADKIVFIYRDSVYAKRGVSESSNFSDNEKENIKNKFDELDSDVVEIIVDKNRNGPIGTAKCYFHKDTTLFFGECAENYIKQQKEKDRTYSSELVEDESPIYNEESGPSVSVAEKAHPIAGNFKNQIENLY